MPFLLQVVAGPHKGRCFLVEEGAPLLLGRSRHAETRLEDPGVSRVHCEIELEDGQVLVTDLDSAGGTFVNGQRITEQQLRPGDVVQIGSTQMRLVPSGTPPADDDEPSLPPSASVHLPQLPPERLNELTGQTLSHYRVGKQIGRGQSGLVFEASDFKDDRTVALKVLWPAASSNNAVLRRFVRTVKTLVPLKHPNLVAFRGAGKTGPYCWMAMELVEGESLDQVIDRVGVAGMLDWRIAFHVAVHLARALEYAHSQGIIHRNLTPRNVLIQSADKVTKLGDLMLAKALEGQLAEQITRPGEILGDLRYMAPERTRGAADVDGRSDLYSLGALAYAVLTGRPPFDGATLVDKITSIRNDAPVPPRKFQMSIPGQCEGIVLKLLSKRPEDRYATATALLRELERVAKLNGLKV
jgi:serine/threonine protein kinase